MPVDPWWRSGVVYQIYPRSFLDTSGDGVGDLEGIRRRLDYLAWLGVDALWLSPIFRSPMADFGYDVSDYCDVDPLFGSLAELDRLVAEAHARGLRIVLDWVPNHTSDRHPWFLESRAEPLEREARLVRLARPGARRRAAQQLDGRVPSRHARHGPSIAATGQYYLHCFLPEQPDLDWSNPEVAAAMHDVLRFWLDRGIDGFRVDVVHCLGKDPALPDDPPDLAGIPHCALNDQPATHGVLRGIRDVSSTATPAIGCSSARSISSCSPTSRATTAAATSCTWSSTCRARCTRPGTRPPGASAREAVQAAYAAAGAWPTLVLSNHDTPRHRTRLGSEARARAAAVLLLTLPGTPFLYAGEELGLEDAVVPPDRRVDPGGRDGCRAPIPVGRVRASRLGRRALAAVAAGGRSARAVSVLRDDPASILHLYRRLLAARRASPALQVGDWTVREAPDGVLAYERVAGADRRLVLVNFTSEPVTVPAAGRVAVASDGGGEGAGFRGELAADAAVVLVPGR